MPMENPKIVLNMFHMKLESPIPSYFVAIPKRGTIPSPYIIDAIDTFIVPPKRIKYRPSASSIDAIVITPVAIYMSFMTLCKLHIFLSH